MSDIPSSFSLVQQESVQFNQPVSENSLGSIGALANALRRTMLPVGSVIPSVLTEAQFQSQNTNPTPETWVLADGRDVSGSSYQLVTGQTTIPDMRGVSVRGKNNGRSDGNQNPDGDLTLGQFTASRFTNHNHGFNDPGHVHSMSPDFGNAGTNYNSGNNRQAYAITPFGTGQQTASSHTNINFVGEGGNDTAPSNVTLNYFIRIN